MSSTITERQRINTSSAVKVPCKAATTANITLLGEQTIDGVSCVTNDRVLVKNQTTASENGIYLVDTSGWSRARDWDGSYDVKKGTFVYVTGGTNSGFWYVTTSDPIVPGTTSVTIAQASSQLITFSAFAQLLLDDADAAAMFTTLGISAYIQTLLNDADAATARTTLGAVGLTGNETIAGDKTFSGTTTLGTAVVSTAGVHTAGTVPLARMLRTEASGENAGAVTLTSSETTITTADLGTVNTGDRILISAAVVGATKGGTAGSVAIYVGSSSGTATITAYNDRDRLYGPLVTVAAVNTYNGNVSGILNVTSGGTLVVKLYGASAGSDSSILAGQGQIHAIVLNNG